MIRMMDNPYLFDAAQAATSLLSFTQERCSLPYLAFRIPPAPPLRGAAPANIHIGQIWEQTAQTKEQTKRACMFLYAIKSINKSCLGTDGTYKNRLTRMRTRARASFSFFPSDNPF